MSLRARHRDTIVVKELLEARVIKRRAILLPA